MEYVFGHDNESGHETLRTKGTTHTDLQGFCETVREYDDSTITDTFLTLEKYRTAEDAEGMCYDWYTIDKHNRVIDRTKAVEAMAAELKKQNTDVQLALVELYEMMVPAKQ